MELKQYNIRSCFYVLEVICYCSYTLKLIRKIPSNIPVNQWQQTQHFTISITTSNRLEYDKRKTYNGDVFIGIDKAKA